jgi:hypothetical protein
LSRFAAAPAGLSAHKLISTKMSVLGTVNVIFNEQAARTDQ